jgi:large subunit ribosomal protein L23
MDPYQIIVRPLVTEKGTNLSEQENQYQFEVHPDANKVQIGSAVSQIYGVRVAKVRTVNRKGKARRYRYKIGHTKATKKAIVTLHEEDHIDLF